MSEAMASVGGFAFAIILIIVPLAQAIMIFFLTYEFQWFCLNPTITGTCLAEPDNFLVSKKLQWNVLELDLYIIIIVLSWFLSSWML